MTLNIDLHCHSTCSDGTMDVADLAQRAVANGVQVWALTDHDEVAGLATARFIVEQHGVRFVDGVEISISYAGRTVHIIGLGFDPKNAALVNGLQSIRDGRESRGERIAGELDKLGIHGTLEGAQKYADNPELLSRMHFARYMVEAGVRPTVKEVFANYLTKGKPGYVEHQWPRLEQAVGWIKGAGGVAVIAHPARYNYDPNVEHALFTEFAELGGQGIEAVTGSHKVHECSYYAEVAQDYGFYLSRGSDFHCPVESDYDLGAMPPDPIGVPSVLELLPAFADMTA